MKNLVIGLGEVGSAIQKILQCDGYDAAGPLAQGDHYDVLHICFPYSEPFVGYVRGYIELFQPSLVIVHSSVPLGTCDPQGWVHSPVRGVHPNLEEGIRTFKKYFGGNLAAEASWIFRERGLDCYVTEHARTTEALKLWDTTQYGVMIALQKEIYSYCKRHNLDFDLVYGDANRTYNEGYNKLGRQEVARPHLKQIDGPIGGHCVIPNAELLRDNEIGHVMLCLDALLKINDMLLDKSPNTQHE